MGTTAPAEPQADDQIDPERGTAGGAEGVAGQTAMAGLFGRSMLYVVVGSLPLVTATLVSPVLAHVLGPGDFGRLASAIALHQVLIVLATIGLDQALVLQRADEGSDRGARGLVALGVAIAAVATAAAAVTAPWWSGELGFDGPPVLLAAAVAWTAPAAAVQLALALLLSQDRLRAFTLVSLVSAVGGQVGGLGVVLLVERSADAHLVGTVASQVLAMVIALVLVRPRWRGVLDLPVVHRALRFGAPLLVSGLSVVVLNAGDRLVVQRLLGSAEVGRYQVAYTVGFVVVLLLGLASQSWAAPLAAVRDEAERWSLITRSRDELHRLALPAVLGVTLAAPVLLRVVAPASFEPERLLVVTFLVALSAFPVVAGNASARALITARRSRPLALSGVCAAAVNTALNLVAVPRWGIAGAAAATVVAFTVQAVLHRRALPAGLAWQSTPSRLVLLGLAVCAVCAASTLAPQDAGWIAVRFVAALACLPWLLHQLRSARGADRTAAPSSP